MSALELHDALDFHSRQQSSGSIGTGHLEKELIMKFIDLRRGILVTAAVAAIHLVIADAAGAQDAPDIRTVVLSGDQAPGADEGVTFTTFGAPVVNDAGQTAFRGVVTGTGVTVDDDSGVWSEGSGAFALVAREGDEPPGIPPPCCAPLEFSQFFDPSGNGFNLALSASGVTAFGVDFRNSFGSLRGSGLWSESGGVLTKIAATGDPALGAGAGVTFRAFINLAQNNAGNMGFISLLRQADGTSSGAGLWSDVAGGLNPIAVDGEVEPTTGLTLLGFAFPNPALNDGGQSAFSAFVSDDGVATRSIWFEDSGVRSLIAREGEPAPGIPGATYFFFESPVLNNAGQIAFKNNTRVGGGFGPQGIWLHDPAAAALPELVVKRGDAAPESPSPATFTGFFAPVLSGAGQVAFKAGTTGGPLFSDHQGIWTGEQGNLRLVAHRGQQAPGAPAGQVFCFLIGPELNSSGQVAFMARLGNGPADVFCTAGVGIWAEDADGELTLIARKGDTLDVAPSDSRTISGLSTEFSNNLVIRPHSGNEDGRPSAFNNDGALAFTATFDDGTSGIFVASLERDPVSLLDNLIDTVVQLGLNPGVTNPLLDKLNSARTKITNDNPNDDGTAINMLNDFISIVEAKRDKAIDSSDADMLIAAAVDIIAVLEAT